jgi:hypothetical protein
MATLDTTPSYDGHVYYDEDCFGVTSGYGVEDTTALVRADGFRDEIEVIVEEVPTITQRRRRHRGFLKFTGITLPTGITKVELIIDLSAIKGGASENINFTNLATNNPEGADPATLYSAISSVSVYATTSYASTGVKTIDLGAAAITQIMSNSTFFYLGLYCDLARNELDGTFTTTGTNESGYQFDSTEGTPDPILRITYSTGKRRSFVHVI